MIILGLDEVGRGSWAGPLVVGAVILNCPIKGITDSKLLDRFSREKYYQKILKLAEDYSLGWVWPNEIDHLGLTKSTTLGIKRALKGISANYDQLIIDGSINYLKSNLKAVNIIKADFSVPTVSAASILAKVNRDNYMIKMSELYKDYGFERNVGYGTKQHISSLKKQGICSLHRLSYKPIKNLLA